MKFFEPGGRRGASHIPLPSNRPFEGGHKTPELNEYERRMTETWPDFAATSAAIRDWATSLNRDELADGAIGILSDNLRRRMSPANCFHELRQYFERSGAQRKAA